MRTEASLRHRVLAACTLLAVAIGGVFWAASFVLIESVEHELIDERLTRVADGLLTQRRAGLTVTPPMDLRVIAHAQAPAPLRTLAPGVHELELEGRVQHVLVVAGADGFVLIDDESDFERLESIAHVVLTLGFAAGILLALGIGRGLASRVIAPVIRLAHAAQRDTLPEHPGLLSSGDEIGTLARAFEARTAELQRVLDRERLFTADVSHELRTPLTVMLGAAEVLAARLDDRPDLRAAAERIRRNAADMSARVGALLQLARTPASMRRERVELRALVRREVERSRALLEGKPVEMRLDAPQEVWAEAPAELAAIAIDNLLRNACSFTQQGHVAVALTPSRLVVEDTGPGVPEPVRARLFEPFVRGKHAGAAGSGLGLSIVQRVAEHLGWAVWLEDNAPCGSRFVLRFTGQDEAADARGPVSAAPA